MIKNFKDKETEKIFNGIYSRKLPGNIQQTALRKLKYLNRAMNKEDLRVPPGNHFEALEGKENVFSIRINDQWRITFGWENGATDVKIEDYH